jgi:hypothetical protein
LHPALNEKREGSLIFQQASLNLYLSLQVDKIFVTIKTKLSLIINLILRIIESIKYLADNIKITDIKYKYIKNNYENNSKILNNKCMIIFRSR